jgi:opacity protein-like surface antigen
MRSCNLCFITAFIACLSPVLVTPSQTQAADMAVPLLLPDDEVYPVTPQRRPSVYLGLRGSASFLNETDFAIAGPTTVSNDYENGLGISLQAGHTLPHLYHDLGLRGEIEFGYVAHDIDSHNVGGALFTGDNAFGETSAFYLMANAYVEYELGYFRPFVGVGLGMARIAFKEHGVAGVGTVMDDSDNVLAYQLSAGVSYDLYERLTLDANYRYLNFTDVELSAVDSTASSSDVGYHLFQMGLRSHF